MAWKVMLKHEMIKVIGVEEIRVETILSKKQESTLKRITNLKELLSAAHNKRAVVVPRSRSYNKPKPAMFMMNMCGTILIRLFEQGMFVYNKPK